MGIEELLSRFKGVVSSGINRWKAICPGHVDARASLAITLGENGKILIHCHAGCDTENVLHLSRLRMVDLFGDEKNPGETGGIGSRVGQLSSATASLRHKVYSILLQESELAYPHHLALLRRGLSAVAIGVNHYGSLALETAKAAIARARREVGHDNLLSVPGFVKDATGNIRAVRTSGLLVPVRDCKCQIIGLQVRSDDELDAAKYRWLSCSDNSVGSPTHVPLAVQGQRSIQTLRVTEGPLKADIATYLQPDTPTLGIPGVSAWRGLLGTLRVLQPKSIRIAYDSDWRTNPSIRSALVKLYRLLESEMYEVVIEVWDDRYKGIDDLLAAGKLPLVA
jgi:DNA primase